MLRLVSLWYSFATHLLEYVTNISIIQKMLSHEDIQTMLRYVHVSKNIGKVECPLDKLFRSREEQKNQHNLYTCVYWCKATDILYIEKTKAYDMPLLPSKP